MTFQGGSSYGGQPPPQLYSLNANYNNLQNAGTSSKPTAQSLESHKENAHPNNGYIDPRYLQSNRSLQYQQYPTSVPSFQNHAQEPQRLFAVAVPPPSPATNISYATPIKTKTQQPALQVPPLDYSLLLLSMAEEYIAAAHSRGSIANIVTRETEMQEYYRLVATGLGCLETILRKCKLQPEKEATVRLRYATVLHEETENSMEAEEALSKGISIADRHKLFDLKYNMQHLLARILFRSNTKAAFNFLDGNIKDVEAYQHVAWVYAFRFLKVSLHLELSTFQDITSALMVLRNIASTAVSYGDKAVLAIATTMEALTCLKESNSAESFEQAQRALASVRSLQLDPTIGRISQLSLLTAFVELCCHLQQFDPFQAIQKMQVVQTALTAIAEGKGWLEDSSFAIPLPKTRMPLCQSRAGVIRTEDDGSLVLVFSWFPKDDIYNVGYFLSGVTLAHRNTSDGHKSEQMLQEGIRRQDRMIVPSTVYVHAKVIPDAQKEASKLPKSVMLANSQQLWRQQMSCYMRLHLAFILCARSSWPAAQQQLSDVEGIIAAWSDCPTSLNHLSEYLSATLSQGTGDLPSALQIYRKHTVSTSTKSPKVAQLSQDISLICTLNALLILRDPSHTDHHMLPTLLGPLHTDCFHHPDRQIQSAYHLLVSTLPTSTTITATKQSLQSALQAAKATANNQLMCMVLNIMSWKFFRGVVGEQAEKSARASQSLARKVGLGLWMCVSAGTVGETLENAGRSEEAEEARKEGWERAAELPLRIQEAMEYLTSGDTVADVKMNGAG
ncbi:MAG: hypothetical protein Q9164_005598 [Protoblastenia rupestris]